MRMETGRIKTFFFFFFFLFFFFLINCERTTIFVKTVFTVSPGRNKLALNDAEIHLDKKRQKKRIDSYMLTTFNGHVFPV